MSPLHIEANKKLRKYTFCLMTKLKIFISFSAIYLPIKTFEIFDFFRLLIKCLSVKISKIEFKKILKIHTYDNFLSK